jgi:glucokinase
VESLILSLDFGGTKLTAGVAPAGGSAWRALERTYSSADGSKQEDLSRMGELIGRLLGIYSAQAIGVSFGGPVEFDSGTVRLSHHVPGWENFPLKSYLEGRYKLPAVVDNDANAAAFGEQRLGAAAGCDHMCYITVSTGVGGGWILNGAPWRGATGMAGEIGHMVVDPAGPRCLCGKRGCLERLASGPYMARDLKEIGNNAPGSLARDGGPTGEDVARMAQAGDPSARKILLRGARALGTAIGNAANLINPQRFVLGGGVTKSGPAWWQAVRAAAVETALPEIRGTFDIVSAALGDEAPLWGAHCLAREMRSERENG